MQLSSEYMNALKKRAGTDLIEILAISYDNNSLTDALSRAGTEKSDIKAELNCYAITALITSIAEASGAQIDLEEFLRKTACARIDAMQAIAKWGEEAVKIRMREIVTEDFYETIEGEKHD